jgi:hypothetical protein
MRISSCPGTLCFVCWSDLFGPGCRFADMLLSGAIVKSRDEDKPQLKYNRKLDSLKDSCSLGCSWCAYILLRLQQVVWNPAIDGPIPTTIAIEIIAFSRETLLDRLNIRVIVLNNEVDLSCYCHKGNICTVLLH